MRSVYKFKKFLKYCDYYAIICNCNDVNDVDIFVRIYVLLFRSLSMSVYALTITDSLGLGLVLDGWFQL